MDETRLQLKASKFQDALRTTELLLSLPQGEGLGQEALVSCCSNFRIRGASSSLKRSLTIEELGAKRAPIVRSGSCSDRLKKSMQERTRSSQNHYEGKMYLGKIQTLSHSDSSKTTVPSRDVEARSNETKPSEKVSTVSFSLKRTRGVVSVSSISRIPISGGLAGPQVPPNASASN